jgi:hypothetical protein
VFEVIKTSDETVGEHVIDSAGVVDAEAGEFAEVAGELFDGEIEVEDE